MLDRPLEQRAPPLGDLFGVTPSGNHSGGISRPWPKSTSVSPAMTGRRLSTQAHVVRLPSRTPRLRRPLIARRDQIPLDRVPGDQPGHVPPSWSGGGTNTGALSRSAKLRCRARATGTSARSPAGGRLSSTISRHRQRIEQQHLVAVVDRVGRNHSRLSRRFSVAARHFRAPRSRPHQSGRGSAMPQALATRHRRMLNHMQHKSLTLAPGAELASASGV